MAKSTLRVTAGPVVAGGDALVRRPGEKVIFVEGALPGETVEVEVVNERAQLVNARVVSVVEASPDRVEPTCPLHGQGCGGCPWNFISTEAQATLKTEIVRDALVRIAKIEDADLAFHSAVSPTGYRTSMRMATRDGHVGMRRRHSHDVLDPIPCTIVHRQLNRLIENGVYEAPEVTLRTSVSTGANMVVTDEHDDSTLTEHVNGRDFVVSAQSFFQSGPEAASLLSDVVDSFVPTDARWIIDAYAGIGVLGAVLCGKRNSRLTAIESNGFAAADARQNLDDFDAEVIQSETAEIELFDDESPDVVIADPSRTGLGKSASGALAALGASTFVLVSCDPASMARDTVLLQNHGYNMGAVRVLDMFPQTPHVEIVSLFTR